MTTEGPYTVRRAARSRVLPLRGLHYHLLQWGEPRPGGPPPLVLLHGWMDVGASFQFLVDALAEREGEHRCIVAPDWRGFGRTEGPPVDAYWFPDYLGDLEALLDALVPPGAAAESPFDLLGHSMGGNVAMLYAGVRPARVRRLVNLEGFGLPSPPAEAAPQRYARWLDELRAGTRLRGDPDLEAVARRLCATHPRLAPGRAAWLAPHWARRSDAPEGSPEAWLPRADPAHRRINPVLYREAEALACWQHIRAPLLWVEGDATEITRHWGSHFSAEAFQARLALVPRLERRVLSPAGHMLHHDQPEALARHLQAFLDAP